MKNKSYFIFSTNNNSNGTSQSGKKINSKSHMSLSHRYNKILCHSFLFFQTNYTISNKEAVAHIKFLKFGNYSDITQCLSLKATLHFKNQLKEIFYKT